MGRYCLKDDMTSVKTPRSGVYNNTGKGSCGAGLTALLFFVIALISLMRPDAVFAIDARADVTYQKTTTTSGGQTVERSNLNETYIFGVSHALTSTIMVLGDVRFSKIRINGQETSDIFPMFFLSYTPPAVKLYYISLGYTRNETVPPGGDPFSTSNINASFTIPADRWPSFSLFYNQAMNNDYKEPHLLDNISINKGINTTYDFSFLETATNLNYSYSEPVLIDRVGKTKTETQSHIVSAALGRSFWDKKIHTNLNIGHSQFETTLKSIGAAQTFEQKRTASEGLFAIDITPTLDPLGQQTALINNDTSSAVAGINLNGSDRNIGLRLTTAQSVLRLHLYISDDTVDPNIATHNFAWQLYTSSDGINWVLMGVTTTWDSVNRRIVFTLSSETTAEYFKVVNTLFPAGALPINVSEIEAIGRLTSQPTQIFRITTVRDFGSFGFSFSPISRLSINYNISYDNITQDLNNTDVTNISQGVGLRTVIVPQYLNVFTSYSTLKTSSKSTAGSTETGLDNYSLSISSSPLPTLNTSLNYGYSESLTGGTAYAKTNSINGNIFMNLYKGVDLGFGSLIAESKDLNANSKANSTNSYVNLNLVPWKPLTIIVNGSDSHSVVRTAGQERDTSGQSLNTVISYIPTKNIFITTTIGIKPISSQSYNITWFPSRNIQTSLRYGITGDVTNRGADIGWSPIPRLTLRVGYNGTRTDNATNDGTDSVFANVSLRL